MEETAEALGVSPITVKRDWATARAWLRAELESRRTSGGEEVTRQAVVEVFRFDILSLPFCGAVLDQQLAAETARQEPRPPEFLAGPRCGKGIELLIVA